MTGSLDDELKRAQGEVEQIVSDLQAAIRKVHVDAAEAVMRLVGDADAQKATVLVRISHLQALVGGMSLSERSDKAQAPQKTGVSATDAILRTLLEGPKSANEVDMAVMKQGLSKASAEKAKWKCRNNGWASHHKRVWTITPEGRNEILGRGDTQET